MAIAKHTRHIVRIIVALLAIGAALWLNAKFSSEGILLSTIRSFGYGGLFLVSIVSGFNVLVPIPIITFFPTLVTAGFDPIASVILISIGMTIGDGLGYLIGRAAQDSRRAARIAKRVAKLKQKHPLVLPFWIFLYTSIIPLPNELIVVPLAALRVPFLVMFIPIICGNILFNILVATGVVNILTFF